MPFPARESRSRTCSWG